MGELHVAMPSTARTYRTNKAEKLRRIVSADAPWDVRFGLLRLALARQSGTSESHLRADPLITISADEHDVDWRIVLGIFVDGDYKTDYRGKVALDVGAHKGFFGAYALIRGAAAVISYEPSTSNYIALERHARASREDGHRWLTHYSAVGVEAGEADLYVAKQSWQNTLLAAAPQAGAQTERVHVTPMATALDEARALGEQLVVKIDTEGYECEIVEKTPAEAWAGVVELFVEVEESGPCSPEDVTRELERGGFILRGRTAPDVLHFVRS